MAKRGFTFIVSSHSRPWSFSAYVPRQVIVGISAFLASVVVSGAAVAVALDINYRAMSEAVRPTASLNRELTTENARLAAELSKRDRRITALDFQLQKERDDYVLRLEQLDATLKKLDKFYTELRIIAGFKLDAVSAKRLGSGGPVLPHDEYYDNLYRLDHDRFALEATRREKDIFSCVGGCEREYQVLVRLFERRRSLLADVPNIPPCKGVITSFFGARRGNGLHGGLDIGAPAGTAVIAPADGVVRVAGPYPYYGIVVFLDHGGGFTTRYGHLSLTEVKVGDRVVRGDVVGRVGATGWATGNHLHYEVRISNVPVDPFSYLNAKMPVHIVDGSKLKSVEIPDDADMLISDDMYRFYEEKNRTESAPAPAPGKTGDNER